MNNQQHQASQVTISDIYTYVEQCKLLPRISTQNLRKSRDNSPENIGVVC